MVLTSTVASKNNTFDSEIRREYGQYFVDYFQWANDQNLLGIAKAIYYTLGLSERNNSLANMTTLVTEFSRTESPDILKGWSAHPVASALNKFAETFQESAPEYIQNKYPAIGHGGSSDKTRKLFKKLTEHTYLLALLVNPLTDTGSDQKKNLRRMLRLWLVIQNTDRIIKYGFHGDSRISLAARYLILGSQHEEEWEGVDEFLDIANQRLLNQERTFENCSNALSLAASNMIDVKSTLERNQKSFLSSIIDIANENFESKVKATSRTIQIPQLFDLKPITLTTFSNDDTEGDYQVLIPQAQPFNLNAQEPHTDDYQNDLENPLLDNVDPTQSEAQQRLSSNSVYLQSAEEALHLPYSWNHIHPGESEAFENWVTSTLKSTNKQNSLGATFCWLALSTGRSLALVSSFRISEVIHSEWTLDSSFTTLSKQITRRQNAWSPTDATKSWVAPIENEFSISLPREVSTALQQALPEKKSYITTLRELWNSCFTSKGTDEWLNSTLPDDLSRITSGKLVSVLSQQVFQRTGDANLARSISAHPQSGLPGACGYASWGADDIEKGIAKPLANKRDIHIPETRWMGSKLVPRIELLNQTIQGATTKLKTYSGSVIDYHNLFSQYVVMSLYAATGSRYLRDPFESFGDFNLQAGFVYINDKSDDGLHDGRLVPLAKRAVTLLEKYVQHLSVLSEKLANVHPDLVSNIKKLLLGTHAKLPFFFLLDSELNWQSMSSAMALDEKLFDWPLPPNLFRHRLAQQLNENGVLPEIIDGWLGHAERNVVTYDDYSPRCWQDDASSYQSEVNTIFEALCFEAVEPKTDQLQIPLNALSKHYKPLADDVLFGASLRQKSRFVNLKSAIKCAHYDIDTFLEVKAHSYHVSNENKEGVKRIGLDEISKEDVQNLVNRMIYKDGQMGHHFAKVRFNVLKKRLQRYGGENLKHIRVRPVQAEQQKSVLNPTVANAYSLYPKLVEWASNIITSRERGSKTDAAIVGTLRLCIEKRISYQRMLVDLMNNLNFRIVQHRRQSYVEYSEELEHDNPYAPIQRHELSYTTASLLAYALESKHKINLQKPIDSPDLSALRVLLNVSSETLPEDLLDSVSAIIEQANLVSMPSILAAVLGGRVLSTSLPMQDYLRLIENRPRELDEASQSSAEIINQDDLIRLLSGRAVESTEEHLKENAKIFKHEIQKILSDYKPTKSLSIADSIEKSCGTYEGKVSSSILLVGFWIASVIREGKGRKAKHLPFAENSITTYFSSVFTPFETLAFDVDLLSLSEDEITQLYSNMIEYKELSSKQIGYFGDRLIGFQKWASKVGAPQPDWAELRLTEERRRVRAGLLTEKDYLLSLKRIKQSYSDKEQWLVLSFVLLMAYRFGLRSREITGLMAKDWCSYQDRHWVIVRNNRFRTLKSKNSRRVVPLLFTLTDEELEVINLVMSQYQSLAGNDKNQLLLSQLKNGKLFPLSWESLISPALIKVMREVTGSKNLVLHHCRHSFYNRCASSLFGINTTASNKLIEGLVSEELRYLVLGNQSDVSRRCSMALALLMGHRFPSTGVLNYNHMLFEWADSLTPVSSVRTRELSNAANTKDMPKYRAPKVTAKQTLELEPPTLFNALKTLRLVSLGSSFEQAGKLNWLEPLFVSNLQEGFENANYKMLFNKRGENSGAIKGAEQSTALLQFITEDAWARMLEVASQLPDAHFNKLPALPSLEKLPSLVGKRRQLLMEQPDHCNLVKIVIDTFKLDAEYYSVAAAKDNEQVVQLLEENGFTVSKLEHASSLGRTLTIDLFEEYSGKLCVGTRSLYGALTIFRNDQSCLRNSNELAVAFLSVGILVNVTATVQNGQLNRS